MALFDGPGEMRALLRAYPWATHALGPVENWPQSLRLVVRFCLNSRFPMCLWVGPDLINLYNDAYAPIYAKRHPHALGRSAREVWADTWPALESQVNAVLEHGESSWHERRLIRSERNGQMADAWFTWSFSPIFDDTDAVAGVCLTVVEETEHVLRERELLETRDRFALTLSAAEIGSWSVDAKTNQVHADANLAKAFSVSPELAARGAPLKIFTDAIHEQDRAPTIAAIAEAMAHQSTFEAEYRMAPQNGVVRTVLARGRVMRDSTGQALSMSGVLIDITERKRSEQLLAAQNDILKLMIADAPLSVILNELVQRVEAAGNVDAISSLLLIDGEGRLRHGAAPHLPDDYNRAVDGIAIGEHVGTCGRAAFLGQTVVTPDLLSDPNWAPLRARAAELGLLSAWSQPIFSADGKVLGTFGTYFRKRREPTAEEKKVVDFLSKTAALAIERAQAREVLKAAQDELRLRDERSREIADTMPQIVWGADVKGVLNYYNRRWFEYIGLPETDFAGAQWDRYIHPEDLPPTYQTWMEAIESGKVYQMEFRARGADGNYRWFLTRAMPIRDANGKIVRWFGTCTDIHDRKRAQEENALVIERERAARLASENAGRMKDDFLATLSHELRTPLNPVLLLASESASNPNLPAEVRADFTTIAKNVALEARLIDDLLDLTRITRGKMPLSISPSEVHAILDDAVATVRADLQEKKIQLTTRYLAPTSRVRGDPVRLQQVFWNILRNAAKFTPRDGAITVTTGISGDGKRIEIQITDTGMGMTPDEISRLFNAFAQGDHAGAEGSHRFGGLGLGLAISRMLVELHSGRISATSAGRDQGATFTVQLPLDRASVPSAGSLSSPPILRPTASKRTRPSRILLVEDHEPTRTSLAHLLSRRHYDVTTANGVEEAVALAKVQGFDLLVSDIGLPDGDGYELMRILHRDYDMKGIALTGFGMEEDIERSRVAGFVTHLTKPITVQALDGALATAAAVASDG